MSLELELKNIQKLSPSTMQFMTILQMSSLELSSYVEKALQENPLIDADFVRTAIYSSRVHRQVRPSSSNTDEDSYTDPIENRASGIRASSLYDNVKSQLSGTSETVSNCILAIARLLDNDGRLSEADCACVRAKYNNDTFDKALEMVQAMSPVGIGARSLEECLLLQLRAKDDDTNTAQQIVLHHLRDMAQGHYQLIAKTLKLPLEKIYCACAQIKSLSPHPCAEFAASGVSVYFEPDVILDSDGEIILNYGDFPQLHTDSYYVQLISTAEDAEVSSYLKNKLRQANWLITNIAKRRTTIINCTRAIILLQHDFFDSKGVSALKPMTRITVAEHVGCSPSTVSRALSSKYLQCPFGIFPFDSFFTSHIATVDEAVSADIVKEKIRSIVAEEDTHMPVSDSDITDRLNREGMQISRRTVAKYRSALGIPGTSSRRAAAHFNK